MPQQPPNRNQALSFVPRALNIDDDRNLTEPGAIASALNVRPISNDSGATIGYEVIMGNGQVFQLPTVPTQNKIYHFTFPTTGTWSTVISTYNAAGAFVSSITITQATSTPITVFEAYLNGLAGYTFSYATATNVLTVQVLGQKEISFILVTTGDTGITAIITQEAYDPLIDGETGALFPIGSKEINEVLFVFSTCCLLPDTTGTGEIGVAVWDGNTQTYAYTTLLRSKEFNFATQHQIDADGVFGYQYQLYFNDDFNHDRVFYYKGAFIANGALNNIDSENIYLYGSIAAQVSDIPITPSVTVTVTNQFQSGGNLLSGSYNYAVRLLTPSLESTDDTPLTQYIPVFVSDASSPGQNILGSIPGIQTSKVNEITVTNIDNNVYQYIELDAIYNSAGSFNSYTVLRSTIIGSTMVLQHTGNETNVTNRTIDQFYPQGVGISHSKNIRLINSRRIKSNITLFQQQDMSDIVASVTITNIQNLTVPGIGNADQLVTKGFPGQEYQLPLNVSGARSFMDNETYAFGLLPEFLDGTIGAVIPIGTHKITPANQTDLTTNGGSDSNPTINLLPRGIQINGIDITNWKGQLKALHLVMAQPIPEVLACGLGILGVFNGASLYETSPFFGHSTSGSPNYYNIYPAGGGGFTAQQDLLQLIAPDNIFGQQSISFQSGDKINVLSQPYRERVSTSNTNTNNVGGTSVSYIQDFNGFDNNHAYVQYSVNDSQSVGDTTSISINLTSGAITYVNDGVLNLNIRGVAVSTTTNIPSTLSGHDESGSTINYGFLNNTQYIRPQPNKYADLANTKWFFVGASLSITSSTPTTGNLISTYNGDCFIQKTYLKITQTIPNFDTNMALGFYSMNRVNTELRFYMSAQSGKIFPTGGMSGIGLAAILSNWLVDQGSINQYNYDTSNTQKTDLVIYSTFNTNIPQVSKYPTRFYYSSESPLGSITDYYLQIAPLSFYDEQGQDGAVIHMEVANGMLYSFQAKAMRRQLMNDQSFQKSAADNEILIGSGSTIFASPSVKITSYGSSHKWGIILNKSQTGDDNLHWINTRNGKWMRFAGNGSDPVSDDFNIQSFLANNLRFADLYDTPCFNYGICGFADNRFSEVGFTVRAQYLPLDNGSLIVWFAEGIYEIGQIVSDGNYTTGFEGFLNIWICLLPNGGESMTQPLSNATFWKQLTDITDKRYYNAYTLVFNTKFSYFIGNYTFKSYIYLQHRNTFLSPTSSKANGKLWLNNAGAAYATFYGTQYEEPYIEPILNAPQGRSKLWKAMVVNSTNPITSVVTTSESGQVATLLAANVLKYNDGYRGSVGIDSNNQLLHGQWAKFKIYLGSGYNRLTSFIAKIFIQ